MFPNRNSSFIIQIMDEIHSFLDDELAYFVGEKLEMFLNDKLVMTWSLDDVRSTILANKHIMDNYPGIQDDLDFLHDVLDYVQNNFDANYGINWRSIEGAISQLLYERRKNARSTD